MRNLSEASCKIFPPIGVARVGDSVEWFYGPEVPGALPAHDSYKDDQGHIKRQGARFRIYAFFPDGEIEELKIGREQVARIEWTVELANKKASWHQFAGTKQVAAVLSGKASQPRNAAVKGAARKGLDIVPPPAKIAGAGASAGPVQADFAYPGQAPRMVKLGDLRTDEDGNLVVLGGHGGSDTLLEDNPLSHYANNDGWFDDTSDGPVSARIELEGGANIQAERAWVVIAPPHYSPQTRNVVTLYDAMAEAAVKLGLAWDEAELGPAPDLAATSFMRDIYPIVERLSHYPWVSARSHRGHAASKRGGFLSPEVLQALADPGDPAKPIEVAQAKVGRERIVSRLRKPLVRPLYGDDAPFGVAINPRGQEARDQATLYFMPALAGDEGDVQHGQPETWFTLTEMQYHNLKRWAAGDYVNDLPEKYPEGLPKAPASLAEVEVGSRPQTLTRTTLDMGQGGAFFPGIEITSILRDRNFYSGAAFRVSAAYQPGDITKWMALPWQADFYECRDHWWPTIRPDDVIPGHEYDIIKEKDGARGDLRPILIAREPWTRGLDLLPPPRPGFPPLRIAETAAAYEQRLRSWLDRVTGTALRRYLPAPMKDELWQTYRRRIDEFLEKAFRLSPEDLVVAKADWRNEDFVLAAERKLETLIGRGLDLPEARIGETAAELKQRLVDFAQAQLGLPADVLDDVKADSSNKGYREAALKKLELEAPPPTKPGGPASAYLDELNMEWSGSPILQGLLDLEWRRRALNRGKNDMAANWGRLGVVRAADPKGEVLVERDRKRFDLLSSRDYFYILMNIENYPEFLPRARELGYEFFAKGRKIHDNEIKPNPSQRRYTFFEYDPVTFEARMEEIYESEKRDGEAFDPVSASGTEGLFNTPARIIERIRQLAPFNQLDGSWLERIAKAGPIDDVQSALFEIWSDEIGAGDPAKNHANVYVDLMHSAGIYLPPINSRAYAFHPDMWEGSFTAPVYHSAVALFPETFYPELLGMTLYLEWEAIYLPAMVKLYDYYGYPSLFYRLHVAIDNPVNGHGARARDAVVRYLNDVRAKGGEKEMQEHWQRIWDGYIAFRNVADGEWDYRFANPTPIDVRMRDMVVAKRQYGQLNHNVRRFAGNMINDWFDEPDQFLTALAESDLVVRGKPRLSPFFAVTSQSGPMLKVFTEEELDLWAEWIDSLPEDPTGPPDSAKDMLLLVRELAARGRSTPGHDGFKLKGRFRDPAQDGAEKEEEKSVSWWFGIDQPDCLMRALADSPLVVRGNPEQSRLVNDFLRPQRPMARFLSRAVPELGEVAAREVIVRWIRDECPIPGQERPGAFKARTILMRGLMPGQPLGEIEDYDPEVVSATLTAPPDSRQERRPPRRRAGPGAGAVH